MAKHPNGGSGGTLGDVKLLSFTANPNPVPPFGTSQLSWQVTGPKAGFDVLLDGAFVQRDGTATVTPNGTTSYALSAVGFDGGRVALGSITVTTDLSTCEIASISNPVGTIRGFLSANVATGATYLRQEPQVTFSPGLIHFHLDLGHHINDLPDPEITIDGTLGLAVVQGKLVAVGPTVTASASEPWYVWLIPGIGLVLSKDLQDAANQAAQGGEELANGLAEFLNILVVFSNSNLVENTVDVEPTADGIGSINVWGCPPAPPPILSDP